MVAFEVVPPSVTQSPSSALKSILALLVGVGLLVVGRPEVGFPGEGFE